MQQKIIMQCGFCQSTSISSDVDYVKRSMKNHLKTSHGLTSIIKYCKILEAAN
jgi:predicted small metal-binding protein